MTPEVFCIWLTGALSPTDPPEVPLIDLIRDRLARVNMLPPATWIGTHPDPSVAAALERARLETVAVIHNRRKTDETP